jgi:membrane protein
MARPENTRVGRVIAWTLQRKPVRAVLLYVENRGPALADGITYRALFSVFAAVLLGFSLAGLWLAGNPVAMQALVDAVDAAVPGLMDIVDLSEVTAPAGLTIAGIVSAVSLVLAGLGAIGSLRIAFQVLAGERHDEASWLRTNATNLLLAVALAGMLVVSAAVTFAAAASIGTVSAAIGLPGESPAVDAVVRVVSVLVVFALDTVVVALAFALLAPVRAGARSLWSGAALGGLGLTVLQQLSGLFVGAAASNPLLATFSALIALLLWFNLSAQVLLLAAAYILTGVEESEDRVRARFGAATFAQRRRRRAERDFALAGDELRRARDAEAQERAGGAEQEHAGGAERDR